MTELKYIVINDVFPVVFPTALTHADVAHGLFNYGQVTSAGFTQHGCDGVYSCYGDSFSLNIKSKPGDSKLINRLFGPDKDNF